MEIFFPALNPISVHTTKMDRPKGTLVCTGTMIMVIQLTKHHEILQMHLQNHWLNHSDVTAV